MQGGKPLDAVAAMLAGAGAVIGVDTGLLHVAAALGVPLVAIFIDSEPGLTGPMGAGPMAVLGGKGADPQPAEVLQAFDRIAGADVMEHPSRRGATVAQIMVLALLAAYFMIWPVWRAGFPIEIAQNEGWNAYHADAAMGAAPLYPSPDTLIVNNYPPLSFYAVGWLSQVFGDALYVGRVLSLLAVAVLGVLIAVVIRQLGGGPAGAAVGGLWFVAVMARSFARFVGMDDPQLVGHAMMVAALVWFLRREARGKSVVPPILAMAAVGFYKHNIVAVPVTALLWLALQDWRRAVTPAAAGIVAAGLGLAACVAVFGDAFLANLLTARPYRVMRAINGLGRLQWILPALVLWGIWVAAEPASRAARFTMLFVAVAFAAYLVQWSGEAILGQCPVRPGHRHRHRPRPCLRSRRCHGGRAPLWRSGGARNRYCGRGGAAGRDLAHRAGAGAVRSGLPGKIFRQCRSGAPGGGAHRANSGAGRVRLQGRLPACRQAVCL